MRRLNNRADLPSTWHRQSQAGEPDSTGDSLNKSVTPAKAGVQVLESHGFRLSPE
jgi:hypothetical protein